MLQELKSRKQNKGEPLKRWFFCHEIDIVFWIDTDDKILGFQLAYDKYKSEKSISWNIERGYQHFSVDDGELFPGQNHTPFMSEIEGFDRKKVLKLFNNYKGDLSNDFSSFVISKLEEYKKPRAKTLKNRKT